MNYRLTKIDKQNLSDHYYLDENDECFFLCEYFASKGYDCNNTCNQLILNFKKRIDKKDKPEWKYKEDAITEIARNFYDVVIKNIPAEKNIVFIPVPPSKAKCDPLYDDRIFKMLKIALSRNNNSNINLLELISQKQSMECSHTSDKRTSIDKLCNNYEIDNSLNLVDLSPDIVILVDDVLTTGRHFKAMQKIINNNYKDISIAGIFIARTIHKDSQS
ncbi:MAG: hypothetical protein ACYCT7_03220 [bacterium]